MQSTEKLYESFGELLYVVAMSDGAIQASELEAIQHQLKNHPWGADIQWSFDYEVKRKGDMEDLYKKVITYCEMHGPEKEYAFLLEMLEAVAQAHAGKDTNEAAVMEGFTADLITKFKEDIDRINAR